ncbi:hypothetical protein KCV87_28720 [Actinosynnema pretiosum subsp. pretiosum]|uniref:Uncharacterized protein n=2 Tax=Actinosynnema TaxID=40566 RepID=C6W996_ACTMD|nr:hypothetical protein [Actinosynnema mirum]ACU39168.1 hypothetical protein Amir_5349 [Actinosynnema mirum DSM 43827]QUF03357.1 hypothetical protein KCV87_28720 [Actinosynnema pretiosum subsp. pretiosum]
MTGELRGTPTSATTSLVAPARFTPPELVPPVLRTTTTTTQLPCPRGSLTRDFRGGHLCAHVV